MSPLAQSIYRTLAFFDAQDMPLTLLEIREYLVEEGRRGGEVRVTDIESVLNSEISGFVEHRGGFYFLRGREHLVQKRETKYRISLQNFRKAKRHLSWLRFFPYLRAVAISGSLTLLNSTQNSDIDLFVITKKNRIWLSRFLVSFYFQILGLRRHGLKIKGRFCLNHYVSEGLTLEQDRNLYTAVEYSSLIPVLGKSTLEKFWQGNKWVKEFLPFAPSPVPSHQGRGTSEGNSSPLVSLWEIFTMGEVRRGEVLSKVLEFLLDWTVGPLLNYLSGLYQKRRIRRQEHILVSDTELSFHPGSRGQKVLARFAQNLENFTS